MAFMLNAYPLNTAGLGVAQENPDVINAVVMESPKRRSPNDYENMGNKKWFFTSDLPASVSSQVDCFMHVETPSDMREVFHLRTEHWSRWREKNGTYWSILTIFPEN